MLILLRVLVTGTLDTPDYALFPLFVSACHREGSVWWIICAMYPAIHYLQVTFNVNINPQIGQPWGALILKQWAIYRQGVPARWSLADCSSFLLARGRFVSTSHSQNIFVTWLPFAEISSILLVSTGFSTGHTNIDSLPNRDCSDTLGYNATHSRHSPPSVCPLWHNVCVAQAWPAGAALHGACRCQEGELQGRAGMTMVRLAGEDVSYFKCLP